MSALSHFQPLKKLHARGGWQGNWGFLANKKEKRVQLSERIGGNVKNRGQKYSS